jgi:hypothetical protein
MTANNLKGWSLTALAVLLVVAFCALLWREPREPEPAYPGQPALGQLRAAVIWSSIGANDNLIVTLHTADPASRARIERELGQFVMRSLRTSDNLLWQPYDFVRTHLPPFLARLMPAWQNPTAVRSGAVGWLRWRATIGSMESIPPSLIEQVTPTLYRIIRADPHREIRGMATSVLGEVGACSPQTLQIMLRALDSNDPGLITAGARWFRRYPLESERVIPLLVRNFEDPLTRSDCASALQAYGPQARLAVEHLEMLAKSKDPYLSSAATRVLEVINLEATNKAGVN